MTDQQEKELIDLAKNLGVDTDDAMEIITEENYCNSPECDHCYKNVEAMIRFMGSGNEGVIILQ